MTQKPGERACAHCGAPVRAPVDAAPDVPLYCCAGCETVAALVRDNGWQRFYDERDGFSPRPSGALTEVFDSPAYAAAHAHEQADGTVEARFRVGGVRCAACVWLSERAISCQPGVVDAHVSYGTNVATVRYDPRTTRLSSLAATVASLGYTPVEPTLARHADRDDLVRLGVAAFCAMNVMLIHIAIYLGEARGDMAARYLALFSWASLVLATPAVFYSAVPFFRGSWQALRHRLLSMDVPVAVAIAVMYAHGVAMAFVGGAGYLDSLTMLVAFLLGGRVLVAQGRDRAANAAEAVLATAPDDADVRTAEGVRTIAAREVMPGMVLVVGAGGRVCADGRVTHGGAFVD
ncbi:MAG: heavy metal translocating P-type ATPase metal-binding domain-containing protein, partial [Myxococcales bacterium]|nr:heavy metal translocating P-type ATPase metal-binding domain-containing protein [Myxococcales bacterium]